MSKLFEELAEAQQARRDIGDQEEMIETARAMAAGAANALGDLHALATKAKGESERLYYLLGTWQEKLWNEREAWKERGQEAAQVLSKPGRYGRVVVFGDEAAAKAAAALAGLERDE